VLGRVRFAFLEFACKQSKLCHTFDLVYPLGVLLVLGLDGGMAASNEVGGVIGHVSVSFGCLLACPPWVERQHIAILERRYGRMAMSNAMSGRSRVDVPASAVRTPELPYRCAISG
jgi:hypothetical protein